jgi:hypothetical protein
MIFFSFRTLQTFFYFLLTFRRWNYSRKRVSVSSRTLLSTVHLPGADLKSEKIDVEAVTKSTYTSIMFMPNFLFPFCAENHRIH